MAEPTRIAHPGPVAPARIAWTPCRAVSRDLTLPAGIPLVEAMAIATGGAPAWIDLSGVTAERLAFVRPAPAPGDGYAAWYSDVTVLDRARIRAAGALLGREGAAPFAHVHGLWTEDGGREEMGHLLPGETVLACPAEVPALLLLGAHPERLADDETGFSLFHPVGGAPGDAVLATIRPNEDLHVAVSKVAREAGLDRARVFGLGSLVGAVFEDGTGIEAYATEVLLTGGTVGPEGADLAAEAIGFDGGRGAGRLARGQAVVCVTFECLLVSDQLSGRSDP